MTVKEMIDRLTQMVKENSAVAKAEVILSSDEEGNEHGTISAKREDECFAYNPKEICATKPGIVVIYPWRRFNLDDELTS